MYFNSKILALFLGCTVSGLLSVLFWLTGLVPSDRVLIALFIFVVVTGSAYLLLKLLIFREIHTINLLLEKIKQEDYSLSRVKKEPERHNALSLIKKEIFDFAEKKQQEINELKKLETFRREFLADVSHELKTPIFAAQGFVHTLLDGAVEDLGVRDRFLQKAANSLDALNVLVEDLLTISQLEIGEIKMQHSSFDLRKLCEVVFDQLEEAAGKRGVKLRIYKYSPRSCYVKADKQRIGQVLINLVMNGIKYGKENGQVTVAFNPGNEEVLVTVTDNGPGIAPQHLKRIFERFYRIDKSRSRDLGGTGLGLSIVKHILEAHDSRIQVESTPGLGTTFSFKLKLGKVINENG